MRFRGLGFLSLSPGVGEEIPGLDALADDPPLHVGEAGDDRVDLVGTHGLLLQPKVNMPGILEQRGASIERPRNSEPKLGALMNISDFLSPAQVMIDVRASDKSRLLEQLSTQAAADAGLPLDVVVLEIAKREKLGSTGVGNGVALPHARLPNLKAPFGLLARLRHGIDFDAIDGEPVDIVVLLLLPEAIDSAKGNALASVARVLRDAEILQMLRSARDRETLFRIVAGHHTA